MFGSTLTLGGTADDLPVCLLVMLVTLIVRAAIAEIDGDRKSCKDAIEDLTRWALGSGFVLWASDTSAA
jgi:hypothetical protein